MYPHIMFARMARGYAVSTSTMARQAGSLLASDGATELGAVRKQLQTNGAVRASPVAHLPCSRYGSVREVRRQEHERNGFQVRPLSRSISMVPLPSTAIAVGAASAAAALVGIVIGAGRPIEKRGIENMRLLMNRVENGGGGGIGKERAWESIEEIFSIRRLQTAACSHRWPAMPLELPETTPNS